MIVGGTEGGLGTDLRVALRDRNGRRASELAMTMVEAGLGDEALEIAAARAREDRTALNVLIETLDASGIVHRFAGAMLLDRAAVDDVAQDSLISVVEAIGSFRSTSKFTTWVHTIVKRRVVDYLRRQRETVPVEDDEAPAARMSSMIATRVTVRQALSRLPEIYRLPVVLRDLEGLAYAEIAERTDRSIGTVKSQVSRGRAMVAGMLRGEGRDAEVRE